MGADIGHVASLRVGSLWQVEAAQLLEEHHLVAWAHLPAHRRRFGHDLAAHLGGMDDTQVCELPGAAVHDIFSFCNFLERQIRNDRIRRSIDAKGGIVDALRLVSDRNRPLKRRFFIWHDADVMLRYDHRLFGRLADALMGVSAEMEYASEDLLLLQRVIFVGAPSLDVYAEDPRGQFRRWFSESGEEPLWATVTGVKSPPVLRYRIDPMFDEPLAPLEPELKVARPRQRGGRR
jgi:hypothetical protein